MTEPLPIDWFRVLVQLQRAGRSIERVAADLAIPATTLRYWHTWDGEPPHWRGQILLAYWSDVIGRPAHEAPRRQTRKISYRATK